MLDQLIKMATQQLGQEMVDNPEIPHDSFDYQGAASTIGSSVFDTIASQVGSGNIGGLTEMLSGSNTAANSPVVESLTQNVVQNLEQKNGINPQLAMTIASVAIPFLLNMFNKQAGSAQSSGIDIGSLITGAMGGGNQGGGGLLGGLLGKVLGGGASNQGGSSMGAQVITSVLGQLMK